MDVKGLSCQFCNAYLFEDDEVVVCPICGAPYHKECYEKAGKCVYEEYHGTDKQYTPPKKEAEPDLTQKNDAPKHVCINCGHEFEADEKYCPHCRTPRGFNEGISFSGDSFGGTSPEEKDEDGVTARQVRAFSLINTRRYVPKFFSLNKTNKISWNWAAFLLPQGWFFYRKMYKAGIVAILLMIISVICRIPLNALIVVPEDIQNYYELVPIITKALDSADSFIHAMAGISLVLNIATRIVCGMFGDYIYKLFSKDKILSSLNTKEESDMPTDIRLGRLGGVQPFMFILGYWAVELIPQLIQSFIL